MSLGLGLFVPRGASAGVGGPPPFDLADLPSLVFWLDPAGTLFQDDEGTTPAVADGDPVGQAVGGGGTTQTFLQATDSKRLSLRLAANGINGHACLLGDTTDDYIALADHAALDPGTGAWNLWVIVQGGTTTRMVVGKDTLAGSSNGLFVWILADSYRYYDGTTSTIIGAVDGSPHLLGVRRAGTGAGATRLYLDGVEVTTVTEPRTMSNGMILAVGADSGGANPCGARLGDILYTSVDVGDTLWDQANAALMAEYGIA